MAQKISQKKQSGRQAIVALITEGAETIGASGGATALTKGTFYTVIEKKSGSTLPAAEGHQFLATSVPRDIRTYTGRRREGPGSQ